MKEKSKTEKLKLRGINQAILISNSNSGAGTGPDDCMAEDVFWKLNEQGSITGPVYVCGLGWTQPETTIYGSGSGFGSGFEEYGSGYGSGYSGSGSGSGWNDEGSSGGGGGGTSGDGPKPGGGDKPVSKDPIELMDKDKFVGWRKDANCLELCQEILDNYGISNYGSRENIFRLTYEVNGVLTNWGDNPRQNYKNAIECIDKHLNAHRVIIVGVNHTPKLGFNEGSTDHFIVITGRGYNTAYRQYYYTFMDNASSDPNQGCSTDNRLYYLEGTDLGGDAPVNSWKYTVTQVRPNDGQKYDGTTSY